MKKKGYTLIELLVVIAIIGILMGIATVAFQGVRLSARDARRKADLEQIRSALELYHSDLGTYPASIGVGFTAYLQPIPTDPVDGSSYLFAPADGGYTLCANLEGGAETSSCPAGCAGDYRVCNP